VSQDYTQVLIAAGLGKIGEILLLDATSLTRQLRLQTDSIASFDDFLIIEAADENEPKSLKDDNDLSEIDQHTVLILSQDKLIKFKISEF